MLMQAVGGLVVPEAGGVFPASSTPPPAQDAALFPVVAPPTGPQQVPHDPVSLICQLVHLPMHAPTEHQAGLVTLAALLPCLLFAQMLPQVQHAFQ